MTVWPQEQMSANRALLLGVIVALVVLIVAAFFWYHFTGWKDFTTFTSNRFAMPAAKCSGGATCGPHSGIDCVNGEACCVPGASWPTDGSCKTVYTCQTNNDCEMGGSGLPYCAAGYCSSEAAPAWPAAGGKNVSRLRFKNCVFTTTDPGGVLHTLDVTAALNSMAVAYKSGVQNVPKVLSLDRPLNAFSFRISGVNDYATVQPAAAPADWANSAVTLSGKFRTI